MKTLQDVINEVTADYVKAVKAVIHDEVKPLIDRRKELNRKAFDKAYPDLVDTLWEV